MVGTGQEPIRRVRYLPPGPSVGDIEVNTLEGIRDRGGPDEFLTLQRLDFDLLVAVDTGSAAHTVDFTDCVLHPGDVLWVRAGQVHRWGAINDIEGTVVMFGPHTLDSHTGDRIRAHLVRPGVHWAAAELKHSPVPHALDLLAASARGSTAGPSDLRQGALQHALAALLIQLSLVGPSGIQPRAGPAHEAYGWFRDHLQEHFHEWHQVGDYADRLGYSARTLNRLARHNTGLTAKELIDERVVLEAKRQLSHGDGSVSEIAEALGFDDASNFSSYFRRQTQMAPGGFRTRSRKGHATTPHPQ